MIPFATPQTGEFLNLSQIVRTRVIRQNDHPQGGEIEVHLSDGETRIYTGDAALVVMAEIGFALSTYRQYQMESTSNIVGADGSTPARIM